MMHEGPRNQKLATPWEWIRKVEDCLGKTFDVDVCAEPSTAKAEKFFTVDDNGLIQDWDGLAWCNPPFENIGPWVARAIRQCQKNEKNLGTVFIVPANRSDQRWWQRLRELENLNMAVSAYPAVRIHYDGGPSKSPFPSMFWGIGNIKLMIKLKELEGYKVKTRKGKKPKGKLLKLK